MDTSAIPPCRLPLHSISQRMPYTDGVSPVTDLAMVYGTEGFQMGWGFVTTPMPQVHIYIYVYIS